MLFRCDDLFLQVQVGEEGRDRHTRPVSQEFLRAQGRPLAEESAQRDSAALV